MGMLARSIKMEPTMTKGIVTARPSLKALKYRMEAILFATGITRFSKKSIILFIFKLPLFHQLM